MSKKDIIRGAAAKLFSEKGFRETSMAELSKLTGAAEGTIFYHFKNKEELFVAILEDLRKAILEEFENYTKQRDFKNGLEMAEGAISFYLQLSAHLENRFLLLHRHDLYELAEVNPECRSHLEAIYHCFLDIFESAVVRGQKDGSIGEMTARKAALLLFSMVDGLVRLNTYKLYDAGALYRELMELCRKMLENTAKAERRESC
jgi:AcrR family transcriptional regulator